MIYRSTRDCVEDLERNGRLIRIREEVDPYLEMAEIQRRVYLAQGPAILFERVKGSPFPAVSNLFGTKERARWIFRHTWEATRQAIQMKADPESFLRQPWKGWKLPWVGWNALPKKMWRRAPVLRHQTTVDQVPQIHSWPKDGGAFITLPQVFTEDPRRPGIFGSNIGMYRVQLSGNAYRPKQEVGLHYQIHRGIGVHHRAALERGEPLKVSIFVGGPPSHAFAAVMPLPEGMSESVVAGMLGGRRFRYSYHEGHAISWDADFCIVGTVHPDRLLPEGPFGDHLGYYSLVHPFPVLEVKAVYHRPDAIWPFTVVGRPPQEDTTFGHLIHELTAPMVPKEIPGLKAMHAVDAAGVHPLLLALGSERYTPYASEQRPQEVLTQANAILGFGQCSLAKFLWIVSEQDNPDLDVEDIPGFFSHALERVNWTRDLHFQTSTTMDTLDYSGSGLNQGSKVVIAAVGPPIRKLAHAWPEGVGLPEGYKNVSFLAPGIAVVEGPAYSGVNLSGGSAVSPLLSFLEADPALEEKLAGIPWIVVVDDAAFCCSSWNNFLWVTFTRSNPAVDLDGIRSFQVSKHWGCRGALVLDARIKPHHAPPLVECPEVTERVNRLGEKGGVLYGII